MSTASAFVFSGFFEGDRRRIGKNVAKSQFSLGFYALDGGRLGLDKSVMFEET